MSMTPSSSAWPTTRGASAWRPLIQSRSDVPPTLDDLREHLRPLLSGYKLPRSVAYVDEIPRSATGKANYPAAKQLAEATTAGAGSDAN